MGRGKQRLHRCTRATPDAAVLVSAPVSQRSHQGPHQGRNWISPLLWWELRAWEAK